MILLDRRFMLAFLPCALALSGVAHAATSPREIVEALYGKTDFNANWDQRMAQAMGKKRPFSKEFNAALVRSEEKSKKAGEPWLDFDPISNSQDPSVHGLTVEVVSEKTGLASVRAEFRQGDKPDSRKVHVFYDFARENGQWTLDDIRGLTPGLKGSGWSLRKLAEAG